MFFLLESSKLFRYLTACLLIWSLNKSAVIFPPKLENLQIGGYIKSGECFLKIKLWIEQDGVYLFVVIFFFWKACCLLIGVLLFHC